MEAAFKITEEYLAIPVKAGKKEKLLELFIEEANGDLRKFTELMIPAGEGSEAGYDYLSYIKLTAFKNKKLVLKGEMSEAFWKEVNMTSSKTACLSQHPLIHFTAETGWINDPNGLVYAEGIYHLYFQYNPFNVSWNNMSWGHATSRDLLHWEQQDTVLYPDERGTVFSGSGIVNEKSLLELPQEALVFFYTAAGKSFTQQLAYSTDKGKTLNKLPQPCLKTVCKENRDPKVFWHEETSAYIMTLWLEKNDFAIFRSENLKEWEMSDRFTLEKAWECPDLIKIPDEEGKNQWAFWTADGFYYWGAFDGWHFKTDGIRHQAYMNKVPYAAQTYSGVKERVISISWLRMPNDGRLFTGAMGIPKELSVKETAGEKVLLQQPVKEISQQRRFCFSKEHAGEAIFIYKPEDLKALQLEVTLREELEQAEWQFNGSKISYNPLTGEFKAGEESCLIGAGEKDFMFFIDDRILEVIVNHGIITGVFELKENSVCILADLRQFESFKVYELT